MADNVITNGTHEAPYKLVKGVPITPEMEAEAAKIDTDTMLAELEAEEAEILDAESEERTQAKADRDGTAKIDPRTGATIFPSDS